MFRRKREPKDFAAEIESHIAFEAARLQKDGLSRTEAESAARRTFGNVMLAEEDYYTSRRVIWFDQALKDLTYTLRTLRQNPVFTATVVLTLALGIGANTTIFSLIDAALLRPLPYPNAERIALLISHLPTGRYTSLSPATFLDYRSQAAGFEQLAAFRETTFNMTGEGNPQGIDGTTVTPDFFAVFQVQAQLGRTLSPAQDSPGSPRTVVLSDSLWRRRYGGHPDVLGKTIQVDGELLTIVGVMPRSFRYPPSSEAWRPARHTVPEQPLRPEVNQSKQRDTHYFSVIGRLKPGVSLAGAGAEANTIAGRLKQQYGADEEMSRAALLPVREDLLGESKPALLVLLGAVALLLLVACANVANILLARGATRQREIAIRGALGAGRGRLVRQFLTESLVLGASGGALGIVSAWFGLMSVRALLPANVLGGIPLQLDVRVLAFTAVVSIGSAILFGLFPALQAAGFDVSGVLKEECRGVMGGLRAGRARSVLVISEIALAGVLLVGAGLLLRSFSSLLAVPKGFEPDHVLSLQLTLSNARYPSDVGRARFIRQVIERIYAVPGVAIAAVTSRLPLNRGNSTRGLDVKGRPERPDGGIAPDYLSITPEYFRAMGIRILKGRAFTDRDGTESQPVVIINQAAARYFWPGEDPIGQLVTVGACGKANEFCSVVGVVEDTRQHRLEEKPRPAVYVPYARDPWPFMVIVVRTHVDPATLGAGLESAIRSVDRDQPVTNVRTMHNVVSESLSPESMKILLIGSYAFMALLLACVGIYGVMAYAVVQRRQEIGIRIALGANRRNVLGVVLVYAMKLSVTGVAAGILLSLAMSRLLSSLLYGVDPTDAPTFAGVGVLLMTTALIASLVPAWRATRVDPMESLRNQ